MRASRYCPGHVTSIGTLGSAAYCGGRCQAAATGRARAVFDNLRRGGWSADQIARLAERAMGRLYERGQSGAHLWSIVRNIARA